MSDESPAPTKAKKPVDDKPRAFCGVCGRWPYITAGGNLSSHDYPPPWQDGDPEGRCRGTGRPATTEQTALFTNPEGGDA